MAEDVRLFSGQMIIPRLSAGPRTSSGTTGRKPGYLDPEISFRVDALRSPVRLPHRSRLLSQQFFWPLTVLGVHSQPNAQLTSFVNTQTRGILYYTCTCIYDSARCFVWANPSMTQVLGMSGENNNATSRHETRDAIKSVEESNTGQADDVVQNEKSKIRKPGETPPLPQEDIPPLPAEAPPGDPQDDGWDPIWDEKAQVYYFYNRFSGVSQWTNPRVPDAQQPGPPGVGNYDRIPLEKPPGTASPPQEPRAGGYDPAIHGDYDPSAPYAQEYQESEENPVQNADPAAIYAATGAFNRFTGKWQAGDVNPENHNDENKSKRQMNAYFDVDAAANSHNGKSLKAERSGKKLTKQELKAFKEKRKEKKEEKRRAWLRD